MKDAPLTNLLLVGLPFFHFKFDPLLFTLSIFVKSATSTSLRVCGTLVLCSRGDFSIFIDLFYIE
jgi:hypothetical protein